MGDQGEGFLEFGAGEVGAKAVVDARPEGHLRGRCFAGDVEPFRIREDRRVAVRARQRERDERAGVGSTRRGIRCLRTRRAPFLARRRGNASSPRPHGARARVVRRTGATGRDAQARSAMQQASWLRVVSVPAIRTASASMTSSSVESRSPASSTAISALRRSEPGSWRRRSTSGRYVGLEFGGCALDRGEVLDEVLVEDPEDVGRPPREQLPVLFGRAEQFTDDRDRVRLTHVGHRVRSRRQAQQCRGVQPITVRMNGRRRSAAVGVNAGATRRRSRACSSPSIDRIDRRRVCQVAAIDPLHLRESTTAPNGTAGPATPQRCPRSGSTRIRAAYGPANARPARPRSAPDRCSRSIPTVSHDGRSSSWTEIATTAILPEQRRSKTEPTALL